VRFYLNHSFNDTGTVYFDELKVNSSGYDVELTMLIGFNNTPELAVNLSENYRDIVNVTTNSSDSLWIWVSYQNPEQGQYVTLDWNIAEVT